MMTHDARPAAGSRIVGWSVLVGGILVACADTGTSPSPSIDGGSDAPAIDTQSDASCVGPRCFDVSELAAGTAHACALLVNRTVHCWGGDLYRQLGDGVTPSSVALCNVLGEGVPCEPRATKVPGIDDAIAIAAGGATTCALRIDGSVSCWGLNDFGELGHPATTSGDGVCGTRACNGTPSRVRDLPPSDRIAVGNGFACARSSTSISCWGRNDLGQLGRGTLTTSEAPGRVELGGTVAALALRSHACAALADGRLYCWGGNAGRAIQTNEGDAASCEGMLPCYTSPRAIAFVAERPASIVELAVTDGVVCLRDGSGGIFCGGNTKLGGVGSGESGIGATALKRVDVGATIKALRAGANHLCVVDTAGNTSCWGASALGQIGVGQPFPDECFAGDPPCASRPRSLSMPARIEELAVGSDFAVGGMAGGAMVGWGLNVFGQTGRPPSSAGDVPCTVAPELALGVCATSPAPATLVFVR